ncbi:bacterial Ig-like domain protein [Pseudomonas oryzihabitans]|nr:bacterial Ig-like domain protein [Pseudomonas psychrotolerans]
MKPNEYKKPSTYSTAIIDGSNGSIRFNTADVRPDTQAATDASAYVQALSTALDEYLNSDDWREAAAERTPCEFRPAGSEATGQQIITMADRSVTFDPRKNWDNQIVNKGEALAGSLVFTEQTDAALLISHRVSILDHNLIAGWTEGSMLQTAEKMLRDIEYTAAGQVAAILSTAESTEAFTEAAPTGKPQAVAEDLIDLLTIHVNQTVGTSLADFAVLLPSSLVPILERAAQRVGLEDLEALIGATVQPYTGSDYGIFMIPKLFTSLSYRQGRSGDVWRVLVTRNAPAQSWDLEILATVDIVANGKVKIALTKDGLQTETVAFPMVTNIKLEAN